MQIKVDNKWKQVFVNEKGGEDWGEQEPVSLI